MVNYDNITPIRITFEDYTDEFGLFHLHAEAHDPTIPEHHLALLIKVTDKDSGIFQDWLIYRPKWAYNKPQYFTIDNTKPIYNGKAVMVQAYPFYPIQLRRSATFISHLACIAWIKDNDPEHAGWSTFKPHSLRQYTHEFISQ